MEKEHAETSKKATDNILPVAEKPVAHDQETHLSSSKVPTGRRERNHVFMIDLFVSLIITVEPHGEMGSAC